MPVFLSETVFDSGYARIVGVNHLKMELFQKNNPEFKIQAIAFDKGKYINDVLSGKSFSICYQIQENNFNNRTTIQLIIKDLIF